MADCYHLVGYVMIINGYKLYVMGGRSDIPSGKLTVGQLDPDFVMISLVETVVFQPRSMAGSKCQFTGGYVLLPTEPLT